MARFNDTNVPEAIAPHLQPGEKLLNYAYGVKLPGLIMIALLLGALGAALLTKHYIVALTDRRLLVLRFKGKLKVIEAMDWPLANRPPATGSTGALFTHLKIDDPAKPFVCKFHRMGMPNNRPQAMAIVAAMTGVPVAA